MGDPFAPWAEFCIETNELIRAATEDMRPVMRHLHEPVTLEQALMDFVYADRWLHTLRPAMDRLATENQDLPAYAHMRGDLLWIFCALEGILSHIKTCVLIHASRAIESGDAGATTTIKTVIDAMPRNTIIPWHESYPV